MLSRVCNNASVYPYFILSSTLDIYMLCHKKFPQESQLSELTYKYFIELRILGCKLACVQYLEILEGPQDTIETNTSLLPKSNCQIQATSISLLCL